MKTLVVVLLCCTAAWGQEWTSPEDFPWSQSTPVHLRGRALDLVWREGRPFARTPDLAGPLKIASDRAYVDLIEALSRTGRRVRLFNEVVEIEAAQTLAASDAGPYYLRMASQMKSAELAGPVAFVVEDLAVDANGVRAEVSFTNTDEYSSHPSMQAICYFTDGSGQAFAREVHTLPELAAKASHRLVFYVLHRGFLTEESQAVGATIRFSQEEEATTEAPTGPRRLLKYDKRKKTYSTRARDWQKH